MRLAWLVAMCVASAPVSAFAQDIEVIRATLNDNDIAPGNAKDIAFVHRFGTCLGGNQPDVFATLPRSRKSKDQLFNLLAGTPCATWAESIRYSPTYYRGPIAEYYLEVLRSGKKLPKATLRIYAEPTAEEAAKLKPDVRVAVALVDVGSCVDEADHDGTTRLFQTQPTSAEEGQVLASLTDTLSACIPPGVQLSFSKFILRGFLAEGAFRNAVRTLSAGK